MTQIISRPLRRMGRIASSTELQIAAVRPAGAIPCGKCQHQGWIVETDFLTTRTHECPVCEGRGWSLR